MKPQEQTKLIIKGGNNNNCNGASCQIIEHTDETGKTIRIMFDLGVLYDTPNQNNLYFTPDITEYLGFQHLKSKDEILFQRYNVQEGEQRQTQLDALFLTHIHKDHVAGIIYLANLGYTFPPIYGSAETIAFLKILCKEIIPENRPFLHQINQPLYFNNSVTVTPFPVSHSTVGTFGYHTVTTINNTEHAGILHMADFHLSPVALGQGYDYNQFNAFLNNQFITHALIDSSASETLKNPDFSYDDIQNKYEEIMSQYAQKPIINSQISRNTQNIIPLLRAAKKQNRTVFLQGTQLQNIYQSLKETGLMDEFKNTVYYHDNITNGILDHYLSKTPAHQQVVIFNSAHFDVENISKSNFKTFLSTMMENLRTNNAPEHNPVIIFHDRILAIDNFPKELQEKALQLAISRNLDHTDYQTNRKKGFQPLIFNKKAHASASEIDEITTQIHQNRKNASDELHIIPIHGDPQQLNATKAVLSQHPVKTFILNNNDSLLAKKNKTKVIRKPKSIPNKWIGVNSCIRQDLINTNIFQFEEENASYNQIRQIAHYKFDFLALNKNKVKEKND